MAIQLITGLPGHGKTLYTIAKYRDIAVKEGRPVYFNGIKGLKLNWLEHDPENWEELPPRSFFIIDEAQFKFPVRGRGEPPEWIARLAVHRHRGVDLILITQNPMLIDSFVRRLCDQHWHVVRSMGMQRGTVYEYVNGVNDNVAKSRGNGIPHKWSYPRDVFELYESAEVHTVKRRIPARIYLLFSLPFIIACLVWWAYTRLMPGPAPVPPGAPGGSFVPGGQVYSGGPSPGRARAEPVTPEQYAASFQPRVAGLAYTAPAYDQLTAPVDAPYPAACVSSAARQVCQCYSQQATRLEVPRDLCQSIAAGGFFVAWASKGNPGAPRGQVQAVPSPGLVGGPGGPAGPVAVGMRNPRFTAGPLAAGGGGQ